MSPVKKKVIKNLSFSFIHTHTLSITHQHSRPETRAQTRTVISTASFSIEKFHNCHKYHVNGLVSTKYTEQVYFGRLIIWGNISCSNKFYFLSFSHPPTPRSFSHSSHMQNRHLARRWSVSCLCILDARQPRPPLPSRL